MGRPATKSRGPHSAVGALIERARKARGWSQESCATEFAKHLGGLSQKTISNWETGATAPDAEEIAVIAKVFGINARLMGFMIARAERLVDGYAAPVVKRDSLTAWLEALRSGDLPRGEDRLHVVPPEHYREGEQSGTFWIEAAGPLVTLEPKTIDAHRIEAHSLVLVEPAARKTGHLCAVLFDGETSFKIFSESGASVILTDPKTGKASGAIPGESFRRRGAAFRATLIQPPPRRV